MALFNFHRPKWIPRWLNIPLLIFIAFVVVLIFVGENSFTRTVEYRSQINEKYGMKRINEEVFITEIP